MIFRILGLLMSILPMVWGAMSIYAGIESSTVGPILGGVFIFILGCIVFYLIVYDTAYHLVTVLTDEPETLESIYEPFQDDFTTHRELNTPDPHLIHPDDAKRGARLNIKV